MSRSGRSSPDELLFSLTDGRTDDETDGSQTQTTNQAHCYLSTVTSFLTSLPPRHVINLIHNGCSKCSSCVTDQFHHAGAEKRVQTTLHPASARMNEVIVYTTAGCRA